MPFDLSTIAADDLSVGVTTTDTEVSEQGPANILHDHKGTFSGLEKLAEIKAKAEPKEEPKPVEVPVVNPGLLEKMAQTTEEQVEETPAGRPRTDRNPITTYLMSKIESGEFFTWTDYDESKQPLPDYLNKMPEKDLYELLDKNIEKQKNAGYESAPKELREALPPKVQYVIDYIQQGGQDLEALFGSLAKTVQAEKLDPANEAHQPEIARNYLTLKNFGTPEMINRQVQEWSEAGLLETKVREFKPLLDQAHEQQIQYQVQQEAIANKQREEAAQAYMENIGAVLSKYEVGGLKLSKKDASALYYDLIEANYPSLSGKPTNIINHMLEKIQYVEPDYDYVAELAWYLRDREGFKNAIRTSAKSDKAQEIARELKDAQYIRTQVQPVYEQEEKKIKKMVKPRNILTRQ